MPKDFIIEQLKDRFNHQPYITREELFSFYRSFEPDLKETTFGWRIYALKEKHILRPIKKGIYTLSAKPVYHPFIESRLIEIADKISKQFPIVKYCVWNTRWLNEWMRHQPGKFLLLTEVEAAACESVFYFLKDGGYKNVFLNPDENLLERYIYEETETIIVKSLITKSPIKKEKKINIPSLEKILVDLFVEKKLFAPFQGKELEYIFDSVFDLYELNITRLLAYAKRRTKESDLLEFINHNTKLTELLTE